MELFMDIAGLGGVFATVGSLVFFVIVGAGNAR